MNLKMDCFLAARSLFLILAGRPLLKMIQVSKSVRLRTLFYQDIYFFIHTGEAKFRKMLSSMTSPLRTRWDEVRRQLVTILCFVLAKIGLLVATTMYCFEYMQCADYVFDLAKSCGNLDGHVVDSIYGICEALPWFGGPGMLVVIAIGYLLIDFVMAVCLFSEEDYGPYEVKALHFLDGTPVLDPDGHPILSVNHKSKECVGHFSRCRSCGRKGQKAKADAKEK